MESPPNGEDAFESVICPIVARFSILLGGMPLAESANAQPGASTWTYGKNSRIVLAEQLLARQGSPHSSWIVRSRE